MDSFYTPKQVATQLQISYHKVLDMIALGEIKAYRIGGVFRISEREIYQYLESVKVDSSFWKNHTRTT